MSAPKPPTGKQLKNEETLTIYAFCLVGLILFAALVRRWHVSRNRALQSSSSWYGRTQDVARRARCLVFDKLEIRPAWEWFGRPSAGLSAIVGIFLMVNIFLCSTSFASHALNHFASRFGWMGAANMALCVFFAMKNTPLSFISAVSHAELNILHRIIGYAAALLILLHAVLYTVHLGRQDRWAKFLEGSDLAGIGAGISMLILTLTGLYRQGRYEMFYISHVAGFAAAVILAVLHRPDWAKKLPYVMLFIACLWVFDRVIRTARLSWHAVNNRVTCHPLPGGGTRLLLRKPSVESATPGAYCYLWIPRVRLFQMHPFTIVSNGPAGLELVVKSHQGFTNDLGDFATERPGCATWVSLDGPYSSLPDTTNYEKLLFIAGGSGAAFTFGLMNRVLHRSGRLASQSVDFAWTVKRAEHLSWFGEYLQDLARPESAVNLSLHVTGEQPSSAGSQGIVVFPDGDLERKSETGEAEPLLKAPPSSNTEHAANVNFEYTKLNAEAVVRDAILSMGSHDKILVAVCGPKSLMNAVKDSVDDCRARTSKRIDVHCEDFGGS